MSIKTWFFNLFPIFNRETGKFEINDEFCRLTTETYYKQLAIETAINLISNTLALAEFRTFTKGTESKNKEYYIFNIQPNVNQNASRFWRKTIHNLIYDNEALVINQADGIFVADNFIREEYAFVENYYSNIYIENLQLKRTFKESEVFYFALHSAKMGDLINGLYNDYGKLLEYSKDNYKKSNARRGVLEIPTSFDQTKDGQEKLSKLLNEHFKSFFNAENGAVLPLSSGLKYTDLTNQTYKNGSDSRDIRSLVDDIFDYVAIAFQIPPQMLKGSVADNDKSWDSYMTMCIKPLAELLEKEINRKYYTEKQFLEKTYLKIDTSLIKHMDLKDLALALDILTRNGVNRLDDNLKLVGREEIGGKLGDTRLLTLNLTTMEDAINKAENKEVKE